MLTLVRTLVSKTGWLLLSFFFIVGVLALLNDLPAKLSHWRTQAENTEKTVAASKEGLPGFEKAAQGALRDADNELAALKQASALQLKKAEDDIKRRQLDARGRILNEKEIVWAAAAGQTDKIVAGWRAAYLELPLLDRTAELIAKRRANLSALADYSAQIDALQKDAAELKRNTEALRGRVRERTGWQKQAEGELRYPICRRAAQLPGCDLVRKINERDGELRRDSLSLQREARDLSNKSAAMKKVVLLSEKVADGAAIIASATKSYGDKAQRLSEVSGGYVFNKAKSTLLRYGFQAFVILLGAVLLPILHKLFAFIAIAPHAARAQPVMLRPPGAPLIASAPGISVEVAIHPDSELLLRMGLQSSTTDVRASDKLVLDWRMVFTCIAAGLVNLQRLRSERLDHVVVTGTCSEHRVVAITVPADGAVVLQPRALVGVVKPRDQRLVITRPWRIWWLISWITAHFRYIIFHGPCTLIVQGSGGVQVEDAARGRMINKRLTLGFDAGLAYGAARSASFLPYLRGQAGLFNDSFKGSGRYLYEQRASGSAKGSLWGRGLKGVGDAVLSAFGI